jgi:hypothetical protein
MNKYEQLIEHIINDETDKARELFHNIVVEKSRDIYESLVDEDSCKAEELEEVGGNEVKGLVDEITLDEQGISEEEEGEEAEDGALDHDHAETGEEEELEVRVDDLESALDELKAEFDALMAGEEAEEHDHPGIHDMGGEDVEGHDELEEAEEEKDEMEESIVREYVEKVADQGQKSETGKQAGADAAIAVNKATPVAGKNDMGGVAAFSKGGNQNADGTSPAKEGKPNAYKKGEGNLPHAGSFKNVPGADAKLDATGKSYEKSHGGDGKLAGNDGSIPQNKTSPIKAR